VKEKMIPNLDSDFFESKNSEFCVVPSPSFCDSNCLIESRKGGIDEYFVWRMNEKGAENYFLSRYESEVQSFCQVLKLSGRLRREGDSNFWRMKSSNCIEISGSVEVIGLNDFTSSESFNEVVFSSDSHLRKIHGFQQCTSLC
jgi:hypothetical protein